MRVHIVPAGDEYARKHHRTTVGKNVPIDTIKSFISDQKILGILNSGGYAAWGVTNGRNNCNYKQWLEMNAGDICLFSRDKHFFSACRVVTKFKNYDFAFNLWKNNEKLKGSDPNETWENMFLLDQIQEINIPTTSVTKVILKNNLEPYKEHYIFQRYQLLNKSNSQKVIDILKLNNILSESQHDFTFGHIDSVSVGDIFPSRLELSKSGVHGPAQAGIWGRESEGSCSIVLSGGYEDDIDNLDYISYTGQGGQDSKGRQVNDQEFTRGNRGLQLCQEHKLPVRVSRGFQVTNGPDKGYRYDGLYYVTSYEITRGKSGFKICRFHLESELSLENLEGKLSESLPDNYESPERKESTTNRIIRSVGNREKIKKLHKSRCQVCGTFLKKPDDTGIAIGAHIKGLGKPHNGPDTLDNMLCLCPNHHAQFDAFSFYIDPDDLAIHGLDDEVGEKLITAKGHKINKEFLSYHKSLYYKHKNE
tara:strand:+ start:1024 stop:2454 length:1431 start_codon:yes stop_codon:yes gene_type:complete